MIYPNRKKNRQGLSTEEWAEFAELEALSSAAINRKFPGNLSKLDERITALEKKFGLQQDASQQ